MGCGVSNFGYQNYLDFIKKVNDLQGSCCIFWIDIVSNLKIWGLFLNMENWKFVPAKNLNFGSILLGTNLIRLERRITNMFWTFYNPMTKNGLVWNIFQKVIQMEVWNGSRILDFICNFSKCIDASIFNFQLENTKLTASYLILNSMWWICLLLFCIFPLL